MNIQDVLLIIFGIAVSTFCIADDAQSPEQQKQKEVSPISKENTPKINQETQKIQQQRPPLKYKPPYLGAPSTARLDGMAIRGKVQNDFLFSVLTPNHTGLSLQKQPEIYWFTSKPISKTFQVIEFVLNSDNSVEPILRTSIPRPQKSGIHKISLSEFNITLEPNKEYTWSIALVPDPKARSIDLVSSGKMKLGSATNALQNRLQQASEEQHSNLFAQAGFWYDALTAIIEQTEQHPKDQTYRKDLVHLLDQVGLHQIAEQTGNANMNPS